MLKGLDKIESDLAFNPGKHKSLTGNIFKDLNSYRVGDYRVIYQLIQKLQGKDSIPVILILRISHRKDIYN